MLLTPIRGDLSALAVQNKPVGAVPVLDGSGAIRGMKIKERYSRCGSSSQHGLPNLRYACSRSAEPRNIKLAFLDLVDEFYPSEGDSRIIEALKTEHRPHSLFDFAVVLLYQIV